MFNILSFFKKKHSHTKQEQKSKRERKQVMLSEFMNRAMIGTGLSTQRNYKTAVCSFIKFNGGKDIPLSAMDRNVVKRYEQWLHGNDVCPNTSSCYMRSLRAIYNKAVERHRIRQRKPFQDVFTKNERTTKRSIDEKDIRKLQQLSLRGNGMLPLARDLFLFSFYTMGMSLVDIATLKKSQIKNGTLTYCRHKTGICVKVKMEPCMLDIISKYQRKESEYLFPVLTKESDTASAYRRYTSFLSLYNRTLKKLAKLAGINSPLTSYVPRHSWASIAYEKNVDLPVISKALGHTDTQTTLIYISEINDQRMAQANGKLLEELFGIPLGKRQKTCISYSTTITCEKEKSYMKCNPLHHHKSIFR